MKPRAQRARSCCASGFTLLEVLIAISILVIITAVVYSSLDTVVTATEIARVSADEMRMRQFLARSFQSNFTTIVADSVYQDERYVFVGISEKGTRGAMDSLEFACSSPVIGGASPPGAIKRVYYGAVKQDSGSGGGGSFGDNLASPAGAMKLESSEQMMLDPSYAEQYGEDFFSDGANSANSFSRSSSSSSSSSFGRANSSSSRSGSSRKTSSSSRSSGSSSHKPTMEKSDMAQTPGWNVPVDQFDLAFFDGYEWVEDWDSIEFGRMPWAVRIRINYARSEEEYDADREAGIRQDEDFDYETVIPIPIGAGLIPEEERDTATGRQPNRGDLFGSDSRDKSKKKSDRDKDDKGSRSGRSDRSDGSSFGRSRSNSRGGSLFGN